MNPCKPARSLPRPARFRFTAACLLGAVIASALSPAQAAADAPDFAADCAILSREMNHGALDALLVPFDQPIPESLQARQPTLLLNAPAARVDLGGDGRLVYAFVHGYLDRDRPDLVFLDSQGERLDVAPAAGIDTDNDKLNISDLQLLRIAGRIYIIASNAAGPQYLTRVTAQHGEVPACRITRKSTATSLVLSGNERLCAAAVAGTLEYPPFDQLYSAEGREFHRRIPEVQAQPGAAQIDLDNDGRADAVVRLTKKVKPMLSQGCTWGELAFLNEKRNDVDRRPTGLLPHGGCASERLPFVFEGSSYVHSKNVPEAQHTYDEVTRLKDGRSEPVCRIERQPVYEVEVAPATSPSSTAATIR